MLKRIKDIRFSVQTAGFLLAALGIIMFSAKAIMVKLAYHYNIDTVSLLLLRMGFALPVYLIIALGQLKMGNFKRLFYFDYLKILGLGFIGYYLASYFDFSGLRFITASMERLILFIYPTLVLLISAIFLRKKVTIKQKLAILITYIGIILAFGSGLQIVGGNYIIGGIMILLSALTYAIYLVGSGQLIPRFGPVLFTALAMIVSCVCVVIHFSFIHTANLLNYPSQVYILGLSMAIISTVIPSFLISAAIKRLGASNFAIIGSLGPISTIFLAVIFLGEEINVYQILGTIVVIAGVTVINIERAETKIIQKS